MSTKEDDENEGDENEEHEEVLGLTSMSTGFYKSGLTH